MEKITLKCNKNILNLLKQYNIYTKTYIENPRRFSRLKTKDFITIPLENNQLESAGGGIEEYCAFKFSNILHEMGSFSFSGSFLPHYAKVGRYCSIADGVSMFNFQHPMDRISTASFTYETNHSFINDACQNHINKTFPIVNHNPSSSITHLIIQDDVWIGKDVLLKQGITLGTGCVIGQRAVVTKDVPPYAIVAGIPAKIIKYRFDEKTIERLLKIQWWKYHFADFYDIDLNLKINQYLDLLEEKIIKKSISYYNPNKLYFRDILELKSKKIFNLF
ncbi:CatB-related O-acetyltransferase [Campylobacter jejuni]|uniref:CatB-related O-acetyltransferase n=1 Tax=Campylobacter jejuni TaxID=197 RepID=UPI00069BCDF0|nr:CatB-related O-acetyltransferase [Campylobacter jejuni]EAI7179347.1 CatB-related O-acetyltransferase [Campylobacter coli]EAH6341597.1 CatB-related O-acetyltransferase [Campylobacter jejuni]EAH8917785.1 CatB-related O-acetyltransferase [Campylobacter jejuni]EAH9378262.1 CatB-related O-acetyltransferase [Campylobacter jejuni]EAI0230915.1 CatB-related O-acetyltransferase [Campylobacter jejuni]